MSLDVSSNKAVRKVKRPLRLSLCVAHYDRHLPFLEGQVVPEGIELQVVNPGDAGDRHRRMLVNQEFDVAEVSFSSYIAGRARGIPLIAIPIFPRRLFSQSSIYINVAAGIKSPRDLMGKRVGLSSYQTTLSVLAKGDLQHEYRVPLTAITWVTAREDLFPSTAPEGMVIQLLQAGEKIDKLLESGEIAALMTPRPPLPLLQNSPKVARLFPDSRKEEINYFRRLGFYPIMHTVAVREQVLRDNPWVAHSLFQAFEQAKEICYRRYDDPNWSQLAWGRLFFEEQRQLLGEDPWPNGIVRNRANLERFITYSWEQGFIEKPVPVESLFAETTLDT